MRKVDGGVTAAKGFKAAGYAAGVKYENRLDMAMVYSEKPCVAAGTFTSNVVKAAPVLWDRRIVRDTDRPVHAVVVNTGIANAGTGEEGLRLCEETAAKAAMEHGLKQVEVYVKGPGAGRESAIRTINNAGIVVTEIIDVTPMPHNGCRPKGRRKV